MIESQAFSLQNGCNVIEYASGLCRYVAGHNLTRFGVEWNLTAAKQKTSAAHGLRVWTNRPRGFACGNDFLHGCELSCKAKSNNERFLDFARNDKGGRVILSRAKEPTVTADYTDYEYISKAIERSLTSFGMTD
jgi:hypothetical protein